MWGEFWSTLGMVGLALVVACTALNVVAALILARRSLPRILKIRIDAVEAACAESIKTLQEIEAQVGSWRTGLEGLIEENETAFQRAERKRASAAATVSRLDPRNETAGELPAAASRNDRIAMIRRADGR